ncbi:MAG: hypothetical protein MJZ76_04875 [Bacteroidales bacterium]|nr:hypothetical protein [Bacteroidales bacterium]
MLAGTLYNIVSENEKQVEVSFILDSVILSAHFPERAIVPGACLIDIFRELIAHRENRPVRVCEAENVKFLQLVEPLLTPTISFCFEERKEKEQNGVSQSVVVTANDKVFAKLKILYAYE